MPNLFNTSQNQKVCDVVERADTFMSRLLGLMFRRQLPKGHTLWLTSGNSIHTCFMRFSIDLIFVDSALKVVKVVEDVKPYRMVWPVWSAHSVFELPAGALKEVPPLNIGDQLHVRD